ncbi:MAG: M14 family zinc carboxypeptidase [bacterium]
MNALLAVLMLVSAAPANLPVERVVRIDVPNHDAVYSLAREYDLALIDAQERFVDAYADDDLIATLRNAGYKVTVLVEDYTKVDFVTYNTYAQACSILAALRAAYPAITHVETLGLSAGNNAIPAILVSNAPAAAPVCRAIGAHHGNEKMSTEICLSFAQYLCDNYATNSQVRALVDTRRFWIVPILNPDGHIANARTNANGVDINRDYGYEWELTSRNFSQPEPRALRALSEREYPTSEYEFHTTAAYVNYLWDNHEALPPDSTWIVKLAVQYAESTYGSRTTQLDTINGYRWYEVHGSCQDYMFGVYGCQSVTIETALPSTRPRIDSICEANRRAMFGIFTLAGQGISGIVTDSATGAPLFARIDFTNPYRWTTFANAGNGGFHKMVAPGTYTIRVHANGYAARTISQLVVPDTGINLAVPLQYIGFDSLNWAQKVATVRRDDNAHIYSDWTTRALGAPDGSFYTVGPSPSELVLDLDPTVRCRNTGPDISVYATGTYTLYAGNDFRGPWYSLGPGSGNANFDLATPALDSCRYVRLVSSGSCTVDAIGFRGSPTTAVAQKPTPNASRNTLHATVVLSVLRLPASSVGREASSVLLDATGRQVLDLRVGPNDVSRLAPGVYFVRQASGVSHEAAAVSRVIIAQ